MAAKTLNICTKPLKFFGGNKANASVKLDCSFFILGRQGKYGNLKSFIFKKDFFTIFLVINTLKIAFLAFEKYQDCQNFSIAGKMLAPYFKAQIKSDARQAEAFSLNNHLQKYQNIQKKYLC